MEFLFWLVHFVGIIIGLGAVTVIDSLGFRSRKSLALTQVTIEAHHTTKALIWLGSFLVLISWLFLFDGSSLAIWKSILLMVLVLNGCFLSFIISPCLDSLRGKKKLLSKDLQRKIRISMLISFFSWWTFVVLTLLQVL